MGGVCYDTYGAKPVSCESADALLPLVYCICAGVVVCTIEKANALVNKMLEDDTLSQISCVVVDELHMVGDDDRGYLLELMLTKLRCVLERAVGLFAWHTY